MNPFPDLPAGSPLTDRERLIVETIADRERAADPAFARRLTGRSPASRRPALLIAALAVLGVALLVLPGLWVVAVVAVAVLIVAPAFLVAWALRQGDLPPG
jgi:Flp pilus assembly protein TadB